MPPAIEFLWWRGCPSWDRALSELRGVVTEAGLDPEDILVREIENGRDAENERFVGSPTIRIDGRDLAPAGPDEPVGLTCRVYRLRDGRTSPTPDPADVRDAILQATGPARDRRAADT
jgi:hypothetical protein